MLKRLRRKIILINMTLVSVVLLLALFLVCYFSVKHARESVYRGLEHVARELTTEEDRRRPHEFLGVSHPIEPHVAVFLDEDASWEPLSQEGLIISSDVLEAVIVRAGSAQEPMGFLYPHRLIYLKNATPSGTILIFGSPDTIFSTFFSTFLLCIRILFGGIVVFFLISLWLSHIAVKPIARVWNQQKQFIADASHELKTPLTVILANMHIMAGHGSETVAQQAQWLTATQEEAEQMRKLLDNMLVLAKTDDEQTVVELLPANGSDLIEETLLFLEPVAYENDIALQTELTNDLNWKTDPTLLRRLVSLLVENAIKYSTPGMPVTVRLSAGKVITLSVHNFGSAIPPEDLPHLFDRFYRSDKSRSTEGHGLGLAIARATAERLRGKLSVTSTEKDGTTFTVEFKP